MSKRKFSKSKQWIYKKYWKKELSLRQIAEMCGINKSTLIYWIKKYNIKLRSSGESKIGNKNPAWKGGIRYADGYVLIYQSSGKYKKRAIIVMEKHIGRKLTPKEVVHHINKIKDDDRIGNLRLFGGNGEHISLHTKGRKYKRNCLKVGMI